VVSRLDCNVDRCSGKIGLKDVLVIQKAVFRDGMMGASTYNELKHRVWALWHHTADLISKYEESGFRESTGLSHQQYLILHTMVRLGTYSIVALL
jgi:hypothetical protein